MPGRPIPMKRVMVATPTLDGTLCKGYQAGFDRLLWDRNLIVSHNKVVGESFLPHARNHLITDFMASDSQYLVWIDSDIGFRAEHVYCLLSHDRPFVTGFYPLKKIDIVDGVLKYSYAHYCGEFKTTIADYFFSLTHCGFGFLVMSRFLASRLCSSVPTYKHKDRTFYNVFDPIQNGDLYYSEDYSCCNRITSLGVPMVGDRRVAVTHEGTYVYGDMSDLPEFVLGGCS